MTSSTDVRVPKAADSVYEAAHNRAILVDRSSSGFLIITGETRLDLINRMSTQKVIDLQTGQGAATILTTDIGRIIDRLILYVDDQVVYCLTSENNGDNIARYLMRFVFFNDDFQLEDRTGETAVLGVYGPQAKKLLADVFGDFGDRPLHHWFKTQVEDFPVSVHRTDPLSGDGFLLICEMTHKDRLQARLTDAGVLPAADPDYEYLRIESGWPRYGHELSSDYIPLEANLRADISFNKGCYTGQEIIARMESRGRLAKRLVNLQPEAPIEAGLELKAGDKVAGLVTSAADGPKGPLALGYVKLAYLENEVTLAAGSTRVRMI